MEGAGWFAFKDGVVMAVGAIWRDFTAEKGRSFLFKHSYHLHIIIAYESAFIKPIWQFLSFYLRAFTGLSPVISRNAPHISSSEAPPKKLPEKESPIAGAVAAKAWTAPLGSRRERARKQPADISP